jgi:hypothetical protein
MNFGDIMQRIARGVSAAGETLLEGRRTQREEAMQALQEQYMQGQLGRQKREGLEYDAREELRGRMGKTGGLTDEEYLGLQAEAGGYGMSLPSRPTAYDRQREEQITFQNDVAEATARAESIAQEQVAAGGQGLPVGMMAQRLVESGVAPQVAAVVAAEQENRRQTGIASLENVRARTAATEQATAQAGQPGPFEAGGQVAEGAAPAAPQDAPSEQEMRETGAELMRRGVSAVQARAIMELQGFTPEVIARILAIAYGAEPAGGYPADPMQAGAAGAEGKDYKGRGRQAIGAGVRQYGGAPSRVP